MTQISIWMLPMTAEFLQGQFLKKKIDEETTSSQYTVWQYLEVTTKYQYLYVTLSV